MTRPTRLLAAAALVGVTGLTGIPAEAAASTDSICYGVRLLNQGNESIQVKDPARTVPGYGSLSGTFRQVYVPSGDDVRVTRDLGGATTVYTSTGWHTVGMWTCSGGTYEIQRVY